MEERLLEFRERALAVKQILKTKVSTLNDRAERHDLKSRLWVFFPFSFLKKEGRRIAKIVILSHAILLDQVKLGMKKDCMYFIPFRKGCQEQTYKGQYYIQILRLQQDV